MRSAKDNSKKLRVNGGGKGNVCQGVTQTKTSSKAHTAELTALVSAIQKSTGMIEFAMDGTVLDANENYLGFVGYSLQDIRGKHHSLFIDEDYKQSPEYAGFWAKLRAGEYQTGEYKRLGQHGQEVWIQASYNPILDSAGHPCKVVKFAVDVTQQKITAADFAGQIAAIAKSNWVVEFGMDGIILTANDNFLAAMGYTLQEIKGKHHEMFLEEGYKRSEEYREFWARIRRGEYQSAAFKRIAKGGREVWIQGSYNAILNWNGQPFKVVKYATDITQRVEAEEKLRQSENRYRELFENNPLPSWIYSLQDLQISAVNQAAIDKYGWSREEFTGLSVRDIRMQGETDEIEAALNEGEAQRRRTKPFRHRKKNGGHIWVEFCSHAIQTPGGLSRLITANDTKAIMATRVTTSSTVRCFNL